VEERRPLLVVGVLFYFPGSRLASVIVANGPPHPIGKSLVKVDMAKGSLLPPMENPSESKEPTLLNDCLVC
jgi:hypothetical protein